MSSILGGDKLLVCLSGVPELMLDSLQSMSMSLPSDSFVRLSHFGLRARKGDWHTNALFSRDQAHDLVW